MPAKLASRGRQARAPKAPSTRDQEIYAKYNYEGRRQIELAADYGFSQCRICEIIRRVSTWLGRADAAHQESQIDHQRLSRRVQEERLHLICREAIRQFHGTQTVVMKKSGRCGDKEFAETTERLTPANLQCLKLLLAATHELRRLAEADPSPPAEPTELERQQIMEEELVRLYEEAIVEGAVQPVPDPAAVVDSWLDKLLGEAGPPVHGLPHQHRPEPPQVAPISAHPTMPTDNRETTNIPTTGVLARSAQLISSQPLPSKTGPSHENKMPPICLYPIAQPPGRQT